ncbi:MAG: type III pantothenate kinase [candidate division WOR-3 bacterium]|nr:type III pantothenate kinase [candidate division WOR-3 bacterium]
MILTFDIGNTNIHIGFYQDDQLIGTKKWCLRNGLNKKVLNGLCGRKRVEGAAIASVVPELSHILGKYLKEKFALKPFFVNATVKMPVKIAYNTLGADRIANINGGYLRYGGDLIIFSFGTAITGDVVSKEGFHLGGIILPGPETQLWSLNQRTALVKNVSLNGPIKLLGKSTVECVRTGILNSTKFSIERFVKEIKKNYKRDYRIIITGGWAKRFSKLITGIDWFDEYLTIYGIYELYKKNTRD